MERCQTDSATRHGVEQLSLALSSISTVLCAVLVSLKLRSLGAVAFTTFPTNIVNVYAVVALLFSICIALGAAINFQQTVRPQHGSRSEMMQNICLAQAVVCQYLGATLIFGFVAVSSVVYQLVVKAKTFQRLRNERVYYYAWCIIMPLTLTVLPLGFSALGAVDGLPFCWIIDSKQQVYQFWFLYAWIPIVVLVGLGTWIAIVRRLVNLSRGAGVEKSPQSDDNANSPHLHKLLRGHSWDPDEEQVTEESRRFRHSVKTTFVATCYKQSAFMFGFAFISIFTFAYGITSLPFAQREISSRRSYYEPLCFANVVILCSAGMQIAIVFMPYAQLWATLLAVGGCAGAGDGAGRGSFGCTSSEGGRYSRGGYGGGSIVSTFTEEEYDYSGSYSSSGVDSNIINRPSDELRVSLLDAERRIPEEEEEEEEEDAAS